MIQTKMKKIIFMLIAFFIVSFSLAANFSIKSSTKWKTLILSEWTNSIFIWDSSLEYISINNYGNSGIVSWDVYDKITIECKNWYIDLIKWYKTTSSPNFEDLDLLSDSIEKVNLSAKTNDTWDNGFTVIKCNPITQPSKKLSENKLDINYQTISIDPKTLENFNISNSNISWWYLSPDAVKNELSAWKNKDKQPTFVNILYLQLKTISNLSDSMMEEKNNPEFSELFQNTNDKNYNFTWYNIWLNKFEKYQTKKDFQDAFSWAITLKDVWIAQDVIAGIYDCIENNHCKHSIVFHHKILDKYDTYSLDEIENQLYVFKNNTLPVAAPVHGPVHGPSNNKKDILTYSIDYYSRLENECNSNNVNDDFLKKQIINICNKLKTAQIDSDSPEKFNLWYSLWIRVKNLQNIANNIPTSWLNLKWVFNIYWELNHLTLGTNKIEVIKKIKKENDVDKQYEIFKKIFKKEAEEIKDGATNNNIIRDRNIIQTIIKVLTPWTTLNQVVKSQKSDIDLFDINNFIISNWVVQIKWLSINDDENTLDSIGLKKARFENNRGYTKLKVKYSNDTEDDYYKIKKFLNKKYYIGSRWFFKKWTYISESDKENIKTDFDECYNDESNWEIVRLAFMKIKELNQDKYDKCINDIIKKYNRIEVSCWWKWQGYKCTAYFKNWE